MDAPENFKFDVRIRARMLAKGGLAEADVQKHLEGLKDLSGSVESVDIGQPATGTPAERLPPPPRPRVEPRLAPPPPPPPAAERSQPRSIAPGPLAVDEGWDEEDDEEDESDDID